MNAWRAWLPLGSRSFRPRPTPRPKSAPSRWSTAARACCAARPGTSSCPASRSRMATSSTRSERAQVQIEFASGTLANLVGAGALYSSRPREGGPLAARRCRAAGSRLAAKAPGVRVRTPPFDVGGRRRRSWSCTREAGDVGALRRGGQREADRARRRRRGRRRARREARRVLGEGGGRRRSRRARVRAEGVRRRDAAALRRSAAGARREDQDRSPRSSSDHEITYAEAEPWLAGRDRAAFEKRFAEPAARSGVPQGGRARTSRAIRPGTACCIRRSTCPGPSRRHDAASAAADRGGPA